jgi:hypothetical protein
VREGCQTGSLRSNCGLYLELLDEDGDHEDHADEVDQHQPRIGGGALEARDGHHRSAAPTHAGVWRRRRRRRFIPLFALLLVYRSYGHHLSNSTLTTTPTTCRNQHHYTEPHLEVGIQLGQVVGRGAEDEGLDERPREGVEPARQATESNKGQLMRVCSVPSHLHYHRRYTLHSTLG